MRYCKQRSGSSLNGERGVMKNKVVGLALVLGLAALLGACDTAGTGGGGGETSPSPAESPAEAPSPSPS